MIELAISIVAFVVCLWAGFFVLGLAFAIPVWIIAKIYDWTEAP